MIVFWVLFFTIVGSAAIAGLSAAPWLPTRKGEIELLKEALGDIDGKTVYDLGCGDGRILFSLANDFPDATLIGIELSIAPFLYAVTRKYLGRYKNVSIRYGNFFRHDLSNADIIITFLLEKAYPKLLKKFDTELKSGAQIFVEAWPYQDRKPNHVFEKPGRLKIFEYRID